MDIGPGDLLIAVKNYPGRQLECSTLTIGSIYRCVEVIPDLPNRVGRFCPMDGCTGGVILIDRFCNCLDAEIVYCPSQFRPLNDGDTSFVNLEKEVTDLLTLGDPEMDKVAEKIKELANV